jgi:hypothetical protein
MNIADLVVATMTRVRTADEGQLILGALTQLTKTSLPVVVCDRDSPLWFHARLAQLQGVTSVAPQGDGLVGQIIPSMQRAIETHRPYILYTEPDKEAFFVRSLRPFLEGVEPSDGITLVARSAAAFATFPRFQQFAERAASECCAEVIGTKTDYFYGPFVIANHAARLIGGARAELGWGWRPFMFARASHEGYRVSAIEGNFCCPSDQYDENDKTKQYRMQQLMENVRGLLAAAVPPYGW